VFQGDSGGPLLYKGKDGKYTQIGVSSFISHKSCEADPSGYSSVNLFLPWIAKNCINITITE
jgi:secreted trypsin-like serine protease